MLLDNLWEIFKPDKGAQFLFYLVGNTNGKTRIFSKTYKQISKDLNISEPTIAKYFKRLEEGGSIERVGTGKWLIKAVIGESDTCDGPDCYISAGFTPKI